MKIAVITTEFMEDFVKKALQQLHLPCETSVFIYRDFSHVGDLYLELENQFDGFMISGPVPRLAIIKRVHSSKKPIADFGTDLQSYYETFMQLIYLHGKELNRGYFDLMDWYPTCHDLPYYLSTGTFKQYYDALNERIAEMSLSEIAYTETKVMNKHISLWESGAIDFSTTRFSSIVPELKAAGVNFHFIYPHLDLIKNSFELLMRDVSLRSLKVNQTSVISVTLLPNKLAIKAVKDASLDQLEQLLTSFNKKKLGDFQLQRNDLGFDIFTSFKTVKFITETFRACTLRQYIQENSALEVCVGYGIGNTLNQALYNAGTANTEATVNSGHSSFIINENDEIIGPLGKATQLVVSSRVTPYVLEISQRVKLSTLTVQKILSAMASLNSREVTPQDLATALNITVRSANRFLSSFLQNGEAEICYERQNASRGRPERVYKLFLNPEGTSKAG